MGQGSSCFVPIVHQGPGTPPVPCRWAVALSTGEEKVPVALRETAQQRSEEGLHGILHVCLTWQAAAVQMLLRNSYIIIIHSRDKLQAAVNARRTSEKETTCCSDQLWMRNVPIILRLSECLKVLEQFMLIFKNALQLTLEPAAGLLCALTTLNQLSLGVINLGQPRSRSSRTIFSRK